MPETIETKFILIEFPANASDEPRGESELNQLLAYGWTISAQAVTGPRSMIVTIWRARQSY